MREGVAIALVAGSLALCVGILGAAIGVINSRRLARGLPNLIDAPGWNIVDCACLVTWLAGPIFAALAWFVTELWWPSIAGLAVFWGTTAPLSIIRYSKKAKTANAMKRQPR